MYLVCISFGGIPRKLSKFPAFSAENKTFNKINGTLPKAGRGRKHTGRLWAFKGRLLVIDSSYLYVVNSLARTLKSFVTMLFLARTGSLPKHPACDRKNWLYITHRSQPKSKSWNQRRQ